MASCRSLLARRPRFSLPGGLCETLSTPSLGDPRSLLPPRLRAPHHTAVEIARARARDLVLILRLAVRLASHVVRGWRWLFMFSRLVLYAAILLPGFLQVIGFYFFSPRVIRSVPFGGAARNMADVYLPKRTAQRRGGRRGGGAGTRPGRAQGGEREGEALGQRNASSSSFGGGEEPNGDASVPSLPTSPRSLHPVVIFVTGGAWVIGYKAWGALLARRLSHHGVLVISLDYRNFPQGTVEDMLRDVNAGIAWALGAVPAYGGDPNAIFLVGQSAGGHLTSLAVLGQALRAAQETGPAGGPRAGERRTAGGLRAGERRTARERGAARGGAEDRSSQNAPEAADSNGRTRPLKAAESPGGGCATRAPLRNPKAEAPRPRDVPTAASAQLPAPLDPSRALSPAPSARGADLQGTSFAQHAPMPPKPSFAQRPPRGSPPPPPGPASSAPSFSGQPSRASTPPPLAGCRTPSACGSSSGESGARTSTEALGRLGSPGLIWPVASSRAAAPGPTSRWDEGGIVVVERYAEQSEDDARRATELDALVASPSAALTGDAMADRAETRPGGLDPLFARGRRHGQRSESRQGTRERGNAAGSAPLVSDAAAPLLNHHRTMVMTEGAGSDAGGALGCKGNDLESLPECGIPALASSSAPAAPAASAGRAPAYPPADSPETFARIAASPAWDPRRVRGWIGVSGVYDLVSISKHMAARGFGSDAFRSIMVALGRPRLELLSPARAVRLLPEEALALVPPSLLLHGTADTTVPFWIAIEHEEALRRVGISTSLRLYRNKTHTQPIVEDPMRGGRDELLDDVLAAVTGVPQHNRQNPLIPASLIDLATWISPF